ncbi:hypothetical protein [Herbiconiux liukaitaii]|uniref:hypothetical protein n=1 Tax=Herbiconiux liukaitaii TaxID=3342799 RepID=UPI0035BB09E8
MTGRGRSGGPRRGRSGDRASRRIDPPYFDTVAARRRARLVAEIAPEGLRGFVEPYLDGGATALAVLQRLPEVSVTLASTVDDIVTTWEVVRDDPEALIGAVRSFVEGHSDAQFLAVRGQGSGSPLERAARFCYLRGAAAPDARGRPPRAVDSALPGRDAVVFDEANLRALSALLARSDVTLVRASPFALLPRVQDEDLVYLDTLIAQAEDGDGGDPTRGPAADREVRSLVGAITARGGFAVAPADLAGLTPVHDELWGSGNLKRALAREATDR